MTDEELVKRWSSTGLLKSVSSEHAVLVSKRLQAAADITIARGDPRYLKEEIIRLREERMFAKLS